MKKNEKAKETIKEEKEIKVGNDGVIKESDAKEKFKAFIEKYKLANPVRYERVKGELEKKLSTL